MSANGFLKYLCLSFVFMGSAYINSALAEGRCPPGQYPIGDQEWAAVLPSLVQAGARLMRIPGTGLRRGEPLRDP